MAGDHFYTTSTNERENASARFGYRDEGIACYVFGIQVNQTVPLYRLLHPTNGDHFYTTSATERTNAISMYSYLDEGIGCFVFDTPVAGTVPLYRMYDPSSGDHFYTTSEADRSGAIGSGGVPSSPPHTPGPVLDSGMGDITPSLDYVGSYVDEGVACYVFPGQVEHAIPLYRLLQTTGSTPPPLRLKGFADLHNHQFSYLGFGGKAFVGKAFGPIEEALAHCDYGPAHNLLNWVHGPGGVRDILGTLIGLMNDIGGVGHLVGGYPEFDGWPRWNSLTHQAVYQDWLFRAYQGGLRLLVVLAVNNEWVCNQEIVTRVLQLFGLPPTVEPVEKAEGRTADDMEAVDFQIRAAKEMEAYIDSISGGPGQGWYRIVYSPQQAREVISAGKLAVVLGIEVDNLFGKPAGPSAPAYVLDQLDYYYSVGIRHIFPIHFSNNAFGGAGYQNPLTYDPNVDFPPSAFQMATQDASAEGYERHGGRRNTLGLTGLGQFLIQAMMSKGMLIDIDHMSAAAFNDTLALVEPFNYPVISSHTGFIDISKGDKRHESNLKAEQVERIRLLGGMVAVILNQGKVDEINTWRGAGQTVVEHLCGNSSETWVQAYLYAVEKMQGAPVGFGTDFNGIISPTGPRFGPENCAGGSEVNIGPTNFV